MGTPASPGEPPHKGLPLKSSPRLSQLWSLECLLCTQGGRDQAGGGGQSPGIIKASPAASGVSVQSSASTSMPGQGLTPPHGSPMLLMLLMFSWLPSGGALSLAQEHLPAFSGPSDAHSSMDVSRVQEFRKRYEHLQTRLRLNQSWADSNPDLVRAAQVRILTPKRE